MVLMYLTQKNHLRVGKKTYKILRILTHLSKDLYNLTLYVTRQHYELNDSFLPFTKAYHLVKDSEPYKLLPSQVAQQTMKIVERNYRSFFRLLKERKTVITTGQPAKVSAKRWSLRTNLPVPVLQGEGG